MQEIISKNALKAIGPSSQAVSNGTMLFVSGQLPIDPTNLKMPETIEEQTKQSIQNIQMILMEAGLSLEHVIKTTVYLQDLQDFDKMNEVYDQCFDSPYPARSTVQVARLPKDAKVEIEVIAVREEG